MSDYTRKTIRQAEDCYVFKDIARYILWKYKIEFLPVELQGFKKKKITMGNDIETSEPLWFALFFHCLK